MVLLHLRTDNDNNIALAKFDTKFNQSYIQFSNVNTTQTFYAGLSNNNLKFFNPNLKDDNGLLYNNNILTVKNTNTKLLKYYDNTIFPDDDQLALYEISGTTPYSANTGQANCFNINSPNVWQSFASYSKGFVGASIANAQVIDNNSEYYFEAVSGTVRSDKRYGNWMKIKFPYKIIPIGYYLSIGNQVGDPCGFCIYVSNDNINWILINEIVDTTTLPTLNNTFTFINNSFYTYVVFIVTKVVVNPFDTSANFNFQLKTLKIFSKPILTLDNGIKICDNNIYDIQSINAQSLFLNNSSISTGQSLEQSIINSALNQFTSLYNIYWKTNGKIGYPDLSLIDNIAIKQTSAFATLDINGNISFNNRIINKRLLFSTFAGSAFAPPLSLYISIGTINFASATMKGFFKLFIYIYDTNRYYLQTITIFGYLYLEGNTFFKTYWTTEIDTDIGIYKIDGIYYYLLNNTSIAFYIKFNNDIITKSEKFNSVIFIDAFHTTINELTFTFPTQLDYFVESSTVTFNNLYQAINISSNMLNINASYHNSNIIKKLTTNEIIINDPSIKTSNLLFLNNNYKLIDSGISSAIINGLKEINLSVNKIVSTNNQGVLTTIDVSSNLLVNINSITTTNSNLMISSNGLFEAFPINKNNLTNLNTIHTTSNSIVIINSNNQLSTTIPVNINNISNVLQLCDFNITNNNRYVFFNSNINTTDIKINSNLFINDIRINSNNNRIFVNNREIGDDIFKTCIKFPPPNLTSTPILLSGGNPTITTYNINYNTNNFYNLVIEISNDDNNSLNNKKVFHLFSNRKIIGNFWETQNNFFDFNTNTLGITKSLDNDPNTYCGAFIIITFANFLTLTSYSLFSYYSDIKTTIRNFKLFGFNSILNQWELIDYKTDIILNNNFIPTTFNINKNNYKPYKKFGFCILNTHNNSDSIPNVCILHGLEFFGFTPFNNFYNLSTISFNSENNPINLGFANIGISNLTPSAPLTIGNDLITNPTNSMININHPIFINNTEQPIITMTRPSNDLNKGIRTVHYLNNWNDNNCSYAIKLSHNNNEQLVLALNSDGKVGIGTYPDININNNGLSIYNNGLNFYSNNRYINLQTSNIDNNYSICLPSSNGLQDTTLIINKIENNTAFLNWFNPLDVIQKKTFIKFGNQSVPDRTGNGIVLQIAGGCIIGTNTTANDLGDAYIQNNILVVSGSIYATTDISTDSDISYKSNLKIIESPLNKIRMINGYTFNRNDTTEETENGRYSGLVAQEVVKVMPEVITKKHDGKLRIIYTNLSGLFVEALKELDNTNNYLNFKINLSLLFSLFSLIIVFCKNYC